MKKYLSGIVAVVLAGIFAFSSAFTPGAKFTQYRFFRNTGSASSTDKGDYIYRPNGGCDANANSNCSAVWDQSTVPATNDHPTSSATFVSGSVIKGDYNGN